MPKRVEPKGMQFGVVPRWPIESDMPFLYANNFSISRIDDLYFLEFGQLVPTGLAHRTEDEIKDHLTKGTNVSPVAKIVTNEKGMRAFYNLLKGKLEAEFAQNQEDEGTTGG